MNYFTIGLTLSLAICIAGIFLRVTGWYRSRISGSTPAGGVTPAPFDIKRAGTFLLETLFLSRTARTSLSRWLTHSLIFYGFMGLLLFHAMDELITIPLFPEYESTLNPWLFLRNLFGLAALAGVIMAVVRRLAARRLKALSRPQDWGILILVGGIMISGFLLESVKVISPAIFDDMVEEYMGADEEEDVRALRLVWAAEYGVVFDHPLRQDEELFRTGKELNEEFCMDCHALPSSALVSWPLSLAVSPVAGRLNEGRADLAFYWLHVGLCFLGIALLPFGKYFHPVGTPAHLLVRAGSRVSRTESEPRRARGMDACTRCGECSLHCSVAPSHAVLGNPDILPSEKLISLKAFAESGHLEGKALERFAQGSRICTECLRCTQICPSGIDLQDLWMSSKKELARRGVQDPNDIIRSMTSAEWAQYFSQGQLTASGMGLADRSDSFRECVQCTTCTSVCPVVAVSADPTTDLDLTPQQIMNLLRMGLKDQTLGARMVWSCTTCYKCQEHCPQNVPVADILYELRNLGAETLRTRGKMESEGGDQ